MDRFIDLLYKHDGNLTHPYKVPTKRVGWQVTRTGGSRRPSERDCYAIYVERICLWGLRRESRKKRL